MATRASRYRLWCFTFFGHPQPDPNPPIFLDINLGNILNALAIAYQEELAPDTGRRHWQGVMRLKTPLSLQRMKEIRLLEGAHWEPCKNLEQSLKYCSKEDTRAPGAVPVDMGDWGHQGRKSGAASLVSTVIENPQMTEREMLDLFPTEFVRYPGALMRIRNALGLCRDSNTPHTVVVVVGPSGFGKSRYVAEHYPPPDAYYKSLGTERWWQDYAGQLTVVFDDFTGAVIKFRDLLNLLDRYPQKVELKGGSVDYLATTTVITSNRPPHQWYQPEVVALHGLDALLRRLTHIIEFTAVGVHTRYETYNQYAEQHYLEHYPYCNV